MHCAGLSEKGTEENRENGATTFCIVSVAFGAINPLVPDLSLRGF
jgi:hypothetical protein